MKVCRSCFYTSSHPLTITFDNSGLCSGCKIHKEKFEIDWETRSKKLGRILDTYKSKSGSNYDCIIPVSGGRDSFFIVHTIKNVYKMNPLLITYNKHFGTAVGARNLARLQSVFNCDIATWTVNPKTVKKITRSTLRRFGSIYWHCIAGQTVFPVQAAVRFKIPLVIWGCHQGIDQVGMFSHYEEVEMTRRYRKEHDLMGYEAEDLVCSFDSIREEDVQQYRYPDEQDIQGIGVRGIYLNNYLFWDSRRQHEEMIRQYGYESSEQTGTFDWYNDVDCWLYSDVHDYIKWLKFGYGKVVDHSVREIRLNRLSINEGLALVKRYSSRKPQNLKMFTDWLGITDDGFHYMIDKHRSSTFWERDEKWEWRSRLDMLSLLSQRHKDADYQDKRKFIDFTRTDIGTSSDSDSEFILVKRGVL